VREAYLGDVHHDTGHEPHAEGAHA